jgi:glutathione S-transferase
MIAGKVENIFLIPNFETHFDYLEGELASAPDGGPFFCGKELASADILMIFPLEAAQTRARMTKERYPKLNAYVEMIHERPAYKRAIEKIIELEGSFNPTL